jgi:hypothetical protein
MRQRVFVIAMMLIFSVLTVYAVCDKDGGALDTAVGMARRITYGALFAIGFCSASLVLRKWMSQPVRPSTPLSPAPPIPIFGVSANPGNGKYLVRGVDQDTRFQTSEVVYADSAKNAQLKVELKGVEVAEVEPA